MGVLEAEAGGHVLVESLDLHAEPAAVDVAVLAQLADHVRHGARRDREADADAAAVGRIDHGVDADHAPALVEDRAAGVALVDRRVDLQVVVVGARLDVATARRDDAGGGGAAEAEGIADRDDPVADAGAVGVAERDRRQRLLRLDLEQGEVGLGVATGELGLEAGAVMERDHDLVGLVDHVVVGDDVTLRVDHEARTGRVHLARRAFAAAGHLPAEEALEELAHLRIVRVGRAAVHAHAGRCRLGLARGGDVDHRRLHLLDQVGEVRRAAARGRGGRGRHRGRRIRGLGVAGGELGRAQDQADGTGQRSHAQGRTETTGGQARAHGSSFRGQAEHSAMACSMAIAGWAGPCGCITDP